MGKEISKSSHLSEEFVQESSDEGDNMSGVEETAEVAKGASEDSEESDSVNPDSDSEESQSSSDTASDVSSSSKKRSRATTTAESTSVPLAKRPKKSAFRIPAQPYHPPPGFEPLKASSKEQGLRPFADLEGKQIWHITAPASVDLTKVRELDIGAALRGEPILSTNGLSYGMQPAAEQGEVLLLPSDNPVVYKQKAKVARTFRLREVSSVEAGSTEPTSAASGSTAESGNPGGFKFTAQAQGKKKEPRKQPERLGYKLAPLGVDKPVPKHDEGLRLANAIVRRAVAQSGEPLDADAALALAGPEKQKKDKKKKKSKGAVAISA